MSEQRTAILNIIKENKEILFGKGHEDKEKKWKEIANYAEACGILDSSKDWKYCRDVIWQNWRKRTIYKIENSSTGVKRRKLDENDMLILEIVGRDSPEGFPVRESSGNDIKPNLRELNLTELGRKPKRNIESNKDELEKDLLRMKLQILKRDAFLKDLEIYKREMELGLPISEFTEKFYNTIDDDEEI